MSKPSNNRKQRKVQMGEEARALVKEFRRELGLTQEALAGLAGCSTTAIARQENLLLPGIRALLRLAAVATSLNRPDFATRFRRLAILQEHGPVYAAAAAVNEAFCAPGGLPEFSSHTLQLFDEVVSLRAALVRLRGAFEAEAER